ncbi:maleylpyruvate isomerase N-terminal domain-containing protein [Nocardioides flavescens]|uniref:Maleylpyruvate isomerase family mycothiol-dependent enzyme n=1 Tax=Nocardioides flavescens TaxID=2691959 RepID=A0A6L7EQ22_9ACTN|nr:maleylpyruvate isomerase N-terminal domain-containing protein [Nocardioides flavescens]MXG88700.1 maleylpyruvate isomerase family mycothiol-dependent enzyme [Nocardioides flavescens]
MPAERYDVTEITSLLRTGTRRLVRSVDAMDEEQWTQPSLLPGWRRSHVVAHLTLNAEALHAALGGVLEGRALPMYTSQEERDGAIDALADGGLPALRERFLASTTLVGERVEQLPDELVEHRVERVPAGRPSAPATSA